MILFKKQTYDEYMDSEIIELCDAMNCLWGIRTIDSCSGHGKNPLTIFFEVRDPVGIFFLTRCVDKRYFKYGGSWSITLSVGDQKGEDGYLPTTYLLQNTTCGKQACKEANALIANIVHHLNHKNFLKGYSIDLSRFDVEGEELGDDWWEKIKGLEYADLREMQKC